MISVISFQLLGGGNGVIMPISISMLFIVITKLNLVAFIVSISKSLKIVSLKTINLL